MPDEISRVRDLLGDHHSRFDADRLDMYVGELLRWNPQLGLVSKSDPAGVAAALIRRSLLLWDFIDSDADRSVPRATEPRVVDIGAGAGFPGLVWKLLVPSMRLHLIERKARKAHFLERVILRTGLADVDVIADDVRALVRRPEWHDVADIAVMMWVPHTGELAGAASTLLCAGGSLCTVHGAESPPTLGKSFRLRRRTRADGTYFLLFERTV